MKCKDFFLLVPWWYILQWLDIVYEIGVLQVGGFKVDIGVTAYLNLVKTIECKDFPKYVSVL